MINQGAKQFEVELYTKYLLALSLDVQSSPSPRLVDI